jgi:hypothetical protein
MYCLRTLDTNNEWIQFMLAASPQSDERPCRILATPITWVCSARMHAAVVSGGAHSGRTLLEQDHCAHDLSIDDDHATRSATHSFS